MSIKYRIDVLAALKEKGYSSYRIRHEGLLSQSTLQKLRGGQGISWDNIATICAVLECQPGDILEYVDG